jgi:hypothetical protein
LLNLHTTFHFQCLLVSDLLCRTEIRSDLHACAIQFEDVFP